MSDDTAAAVDAQQPWLGLDSFSESSRAFFYGREEEVAELARRVQRKPLTVLFGQSGLGKTSILRAGLVPRLRPEGYCPVYVRIDYAPGTPAPAEQIKQAIFRETLSSGSWSQTGVAVEGETLWEFLHHRDDMLRDTDGRTLTPLLIFDQFEEIFTLAQGDDFGRARAAQFIEELADLVENRPPKALEARLDADDTVAETFDFARCDYRILIALREDYLAHLEGLKAAMPSITQNRMRLARMTGAQALEAVTKPGGRLVTQEVAEAIVRFVAGGAELRNAEVEPSLLSLICRELNAVRIAQGRSEISADLLAGTHATILAEFYQRALADQPPGVHLFIEEALLTESGFRENVAQEKVQKAFADAGAAPDALARLVDRRLLRVEERLDIRRVELTHDVLCSVVRASRDNRHEREARDAAEKALAAQREREAATRHALVRARKIAAACAGLAAIAVAAAGFGIWGMRHAQQTQDMAEAARSESERLVVYLLDDFYRELEPVGRLDLVADLAKRAIGYYEGLPKRLQTPETARNRALAQVRYAAVLRTQGKLADARITVGEGVATLERLYGQGDRSEPTVTGLSLGHVTAARAVDGAGRDSESLKPAQRAAEVIKATAEAPGASATLRRAHAFALWQLGFVQDRQGEREAAVDSLEASLTILKGIDELSLADLNAATQFAEASGWLGYTYLALGRVDAARAVGQEGRQVATRILEQRPTHYQALRARALLTNVLANVAGDEWRSADRLALVRETQRDWRTLATIDPTNSVSWNNLANAYVTAGNALADQGRLRESVAERQRVREVEPGLRGRVLPSNVMVIGYGLAAKFAAELGDSSTARALLKDMNRHGAEWLKRRDPQTFDGVIEVGGMALWNRFVAQSLGDEAALREADKTVRERLEPLKPANTAQERTQADWLWRWHEQQAEDALLGGDFAAAADSIKARQRYRAKLPAASLDSKVENARGDTWLAVALARSGRVDEARDQIGPVLRWLREEERRNVDDQGLRLLLAQALYAAALADPREAKALLAEARAITKALSPDLHAARASRWWIERIAEAQPR
jgi:tetratricopeptide (TPR) repeat protein